MDVLSVLGVVLAVGAVAVAARYVWRLRQDAKRRQPVDVDLDSMLPEEPRRRRPEFVDDTAPAVLSVPPELDHPEWEPNWDPPTKRPANQRWLH